MTWNPQSFTTFQNSDPIVGAVSGGMGGLAGGATPGTGDWKHTDRAMVASTAIKGVASAAAGLANGFAPGTGAIVGLGLGSIADTVSSSAQAYDLQKTVAKLQAIKEKYKANIGSAVMGGGGDFAELNEIIDYALAKKGSLRSRHIAKAIPGINILTGVGVSAYQMVKGIHKLRMGTKGVHRAEMADKLIGIAKTGSTAAKSCANEVIQALAGQTFEQMMKGAVAAAFKSGV